jgi:hypothetical protein
VTTNMRNEIEQAALEVGRALAKYEMLTNTMSLKVGDTVTGIQGGPHTIAHVRPRAAKSIVTAPVSASPWDSKATAERPKAKTVSRGVRKESGPRVKDVKKSIFALITSETLTTKDIIAKTSFKESSVNGTLQGLKKAGMIYQDENKLWHPAGAETGNSGETYASQAMIS